MSNPIIQPNFEDTQKAFAYKSDKQLQKAKFLFQTMQIAPLVKIGTKITPFIIKYNLPGKSLIEKTLFEQFVGGKNLEETNTICDKLQAYHVQAILDYGIEGGEYPDEKHEQATDTFIRVIQHASSRQNTPFISIKVTGLVSLSLLESLNISIGQSFDGNIFDHMQSKLDQSDAYTKSQWNKLLKRISKICDVASASGIGVMIDAEETWLQDAIDFLVLDMMMKYNVNKPVVYNTIQLYRTDRYQFLERSLQHAINHGYILGLKLVRGAYMEKERLRAAEMGYTSPIQCNKTATDADFDKSVSFCLENHQHISSIIASHNEKSNLAASGYILSNNIAPKHDHIHFSQLYGMSDNLTFNLADSGFNTSKYLPFGPVDEVIPYLMRRAEENSSISGQTGRELSLIKKECLRRGI